MSDIVNNLVSQHNSLIKASYSLTLNENRLLIAAISKIDSTSQAWQSGRVEIDITVAEWRKLYSKNGGSVYSDVRTAAFKLYERNIRLWGDHDKGKNIRWISAWEYDKNSAKVVLTFSGDILHELSGFVEEFTKYQLLNVRGLKSSHSVII